MNSAVFRHSAELDTSVFSTFAETTSPCSSGAGGCSLETSGASTQETWGSVPAATSDWKPPGYVGPTPFAASTGLFWYCLKYGSTLSPKCPSALPYTFQLMPRAWSCSGIVVQLSVPNRSTRLELVVRIGPPWVPAGSSHADIEYRRLGSVGPITEPK